MGQIFQNIEEVKEYINVSSNLDVRLLAPYEREALRHIGQFVPAALLPRIEADHSEAYDLLKKATANYMLPFAAPFLKVHISNTGINNFTDEKMSKSAWWDVRDYCLSAIRIADNALSDSINELKTTNLADQLTLFNREGLVKVLFAAPRDFDSIFSIGNSWEVLQKLEPVLYAMLELYLYERIQPCTVEDLLGDEKTKDLLKNILGAYAVSEALRSSLLTATHNGLVLQWEQLPWQKSAVLTEVRTRVLVDDFYKRANDLFGLLLKYLAKNATKFPCYSGHTDVGGRKIIKKKSGLYT